MNLTVQQFLSGLERSVKNLPSVLARWEQLDEDLREHIVDELGWMAEVFGEVFLRALDECRPDVAARLQAAGAELLNLRGRLRARTGLAVELADDLFAVPVLSVPLAEPLRERFVTMPCYEPANDVFDVFPDGRHAFAA